MFWWASDEEKENIFRAKITSNKRKIKESLERIAQLQQRVEELSSGVNIKELEIQYKSLKAEKIRLRGITRQYDQQLPYWHKRLSSQKDLEKEICSIKQEVDTLQENEHRQKQEIQVMKSRERDPIEMEDELKQMKRKKKSMTQENKVLQQKAENLRKKMSRQDELSEKLRAKQIKYAALLRQFLQETTEQLSELEQNNTQHQSSISSLKESHLLKENEALKKQLEDTRRDLQQDLQKSEASLEDCTRHRNNLEEEKDRLHKYLDGLKVESYRLKSKLCEKEEELKQMNCKVKDLQVQLEREASRSSQLNNQLASLKFLSQRNEQLASSKRESEADLIQMRCQLEASQREQLVKEEKNKELASQAADLKDQIYRLGEEQNKRDTTLRELQQVCVDSLKKLSESKACLEDFTRHRNELEEEKNRFKEQSKYLKSKLDEKEEKLKQMNSKVKDLQVQLEREASRSSQLNNQLDSLQSLSHRNEQLKSSKRELEAALTEMRCQMEASQREQQVKEERNKELASQAADLKDQIYRLGEEKNKSDTTLRQLQRDLQKSEVSLEDCTWHCKALKKEKDALHKYLDGLKVESDCLQSKLCEKEEELEQMNCKVKDLEVQLEREASGSSQLNNQLDSLQSLSQRNEQLESSKRESEADLIEMRCQLEASQREQQVKEERNKELASRAADLKDQIYRLREEKNKRDTTLRQLQQDLQKSEASLEDCAWRRNALEKETNWLKEQSKSKLDVKEEELKQMNFKVKDLQVRLEREASRSSQLNNQLDSLRSLSHRNEQLESSKRESEADLIEMRRQMEASQREQSRLKQVILFLQKQAASGEASLKLNAETAANMCSQLNQRVQQMERELTHLRTTQQESNNQRATTDKELEQCRQFCREALRQNRYLTAELERAHSQLREANSWFRSGQSSTLDVYVAERDITIIEESRLSRAEEDVASASMLQEGSASTHTVIREKREKVLEINRRYKI